MLKIILGALAMSVFLLSCTETKSDEPPYEFKPGPDYKLVWSDEFDGPSIDTNTWNYDRGASGWGNNELQDYTDRPENAFIRDGKLVIRALHDNQFGHPYSSARLTTIGKRYFKYGVVAARIKLPAGRGLWPAFWMLGRNINRAVWPACGEMDIMEMRGQNPSIAQSAVHGPLYSGNTPFKKEYGLMGKNYAEDYHVFSVEWTETVPELSSASNVPAPSFNV